jgi:hypothetical protein
MKKTRIWIMFSTLAAIVGLVYTAGSGTAGDEKEFKGKADELVDAVKKGDMDGARKIAAAIAKKAEAKGVDREELGVMDLFKRKDKGGWGFGGGPKETDGIELKVREVARDGPKDLSKFGNLYELMAHRATAIGIIAEAMAPKKDEGTKKVKNWMQYTKDMQEGAESLAKAAKAKSAKDVKDAVSKMNAACNACHSEWRNK